MPCVDEGPSRNALRARQVGELLREAQGLSFDHKHSRRWPHAHLLDSLTAELCAWCREHADGIRAMSLELQIWWRDHQEADEKAGRR